MMSDTATPNVEEDQKSNSSSEDTTCSSLVRSGQDEVDDTEMESRSNLKAETGEEESSPFFSLEGQLERKEKEICQLEEIVNEKSSTIRELEEKLNRQKDYEAIKRELSILKAEVAQLKSSLSSAGDHKFLLEKTKALQNENAALKAELSSPGHPARHPLISPFLPPIQNVDAFSTLLGEEIASTYAKVFKAQAEAAAAAVNNNGNNNRPSSTSLLPLQFPTTSSPPLRPSSAEDARSTSSDPSPLGLSGSPPQGSNNNNNNHTNYNLKDSATDGKSALSGLPKLEPARSPTTTASLEKLQSQLRQNVEKYMNENLNTMNISRCVRELLSVHNIGQRLFAKYVLGLSQGTVSELLSKPKPWDKLTEKGRDSYRKMHAWAADEACIYQLKSLVPRKGKDSSFKQDDPAAEERIQAILSEAQRAMITPRTNGAPRAQLPSVMGLNGSNTTLKETMGKDDNSSENGDDQRLSPNPGAAAAYANIRRLMKKDSEVPPEIVARIYQEELAKAFIGQKVEDSLRSGHDVRQALALYQQEISRLSQLTASSGLNPASDPELFARFSAAAATAGLVNGAYFNMPPAFLDPSHLMTVGGDGPRDRADRHSDFQSQAASAAAEAAIRHGSSAFSLVRPKVESTTDIERCGKRFCPSPSTPAPSAPFSSSTTTETTTTSSTSGAEDLSAVASPLQRMQSITNSLLSQSTVPSTPPTPQRPTKAVLPPITQQQFDQYNNLNTEDIVKQVKEQLSQYSISQRLFGESVLGLSQGSVSDLLARPKPWHMLTQKGREPFIRMKMFLEDDGAVHKLVASQYKIAPEKLMRTTGFIAGPTGPPVSSHHHHSLANSLNVLKVGVRPTVIDTIGKSNEPRQNLSPNFESGRSAGSTPELSTQMMSSMLSSLQNQSIIGSRNRMPSISTPVKVSPSIPPPSVYEMAALTTDLDTQAVTTKIKETLMAHNIGQKIFGEVVLGLSQGSVSELLSKPKPWHMLSIKGREPFIRMQLWLSDANNIEKLQTLKNERREANKRRRTNTDDISRPPSTRDSPIYNFNSNSGYNSPSGQSFTGNSGYGNSPKKPRILFSEEQKEALKLAFSMDSYPTQSTIEFLATELGLSTRTITNWFHNHRMRLKQIPSGASSDPDSSLNSMTYGVNRDGATFDTVQFRILLSQRLSNLKGQEKPRFGGLYGSLQQMYTNSCSSPGSSTQGDDDVASTTLDLSVSGPHKASSINRSLAEDSDRSRDSFEEDIGSDRSPPNLEVRVSPVKTGSSRRKPSVVTSSSSRRKAAQPQWVDPGLEFSGDEDDDDEPECRSEDERASPDSSRRELINGVCVRQSPEKKVFPTLGRIDFPREMIGDEDESADQDVVKPL